MLTYLHPFLKARWWGLRPQSRVETSINVNLETQAGAEIQVGLTTFQHPTTIRSESSIPYLHDVIQIWAGNYGAILLTAAGHLYEHDGLTVEEIGADILYLNTASNSSCYAYHWDGTVCVVYVSIRTCRQIELPLPSPTTLFTYTTPYLIYWIAPRRYRIFEHAKHLQDVSLDSDGLIQSELQGAYPMRFYAALQQLHTYETR